MSSIKEHRWDCTSCGMNQGRNDMWHEGDVCDDCHSEAEDIEKKDKINSFLIDIFNRIGIETPSNFEDISQFCFDDVCDSADPVSWHDGDVAIAFRRWIESHDQNPS